MHDLRPQWEYKVVSWNLGVIRATSADAMAELNAAAAEGYDLFDFTTVSDQGGTILRHYFRREFHAEPCMLKVF